MAVKETIAIIGDAEKNCPGLIEKMSRQQRPLLLICKNEVEKEKFQKKFGIDANADMEFISCPGSACWEADIIAFIDPDAICDEIVEKIKDFTTQKIIVEFICEKSSPVDKAEELQMKFQNSRIVKAVLEFQENSAVVSGKDFEAVNIISKMLETLNFSVLSTEKDKTE